MIRLLRAATVACLAALATACSKGETTAPPKPASLQAGPRTSITGTVGAALATPPTFVVKDASGNPVSSVAVTVVVTAGGGSIAGAPSVSANGATPVGTWTLGTAAGANALTVTVSGLQPLVITETGTSDVPSAITVASGNNQAALAGTALAQAVAFKVADRFGNGVPNIAVAFQVAAGEGFLAGAASAQTDLNGLANGPSWTLGKINIPQQLSASAGSLSGTAAAAITSQYRAEVRFFGPIADPNFAAAFTRAVNKINAEVVGPLTSVTLASQDVATVCGVSGVAPLSETVPTAIIFVTIKPIDGVGRILASSGPCLVRNIGKLTVVGVITFDVADVQQLFNNNQLNDVALHEMQHVVGFGTLWSPPAPLLILNAGTAQTAFIGPAAIAACQQVGGGSSCNPGVLLENTGGAGTADSHWRKTIFGSELMTGFISPVGTKMPLSVMTIASLGDLGYVVNTSASDPYALSSAAALALGTVRSAQGLPVDGYGEELLAPRFEVTRDGRVTRLK